MESFRFVSKEHLEFLPGQFVRVIFDTTNLNNKEANKYLSFSSSPTKSYFELTKKLSKSIFSNRLRSLRKGSEVLFEGPLGNCVFKDQYKKIAFLIGGIGITPVVSILEYIADCDIITDVLLLYSNKTEDEIAFKQELDIWQSRKEHIRVVYTVTACEPQDEECVYGHVDKALLQQKIPDIKERIFYIFGPPVMVEAMTNLCIELNCQKENIKTERFIGY